jgi:predicted nuclease with TOPRIM domain
MDYDHLPIEERSRQARQVIAGALDRIEELQSEQDALYGEIEEIKDEIAQLEDQKCQLHVEIERAKFVLEEGNRLAERQLTLF